MFNSTQKRIPPQLMITPNYNVLNNRHTSSVETIRGTTLIFKEYSQIKQIGKGRFGTVILAKQDTKLVAIKIINKYLMIKFNTQQLIQKEIIIMKSLDHPHIVKLLDEYNDEKNVYLILEYCNQGSLFNKSFENNEIKQIIKELLLALQYLHSKSIMHRDIKPENIYLHDGHIKLGDFGLSSFVKAKSTTFCGTLDYMSPEIINKKCYDCKTDIWSIGILAYELHNKQPPFKDRDPSMQMIKICKDQVYFPSFFSKELISFIQKCLMKDPDDRSSVQQLLNDDYMN